MLKEENLEAGHMHATETNDAPSQILSNNLNLCVFSSCLWAPQTSVRECSTAMKTWDKGGKYKHKLQKKILQNAMPSVLEKTILNEPVAFSVTVLAATVLFIFSFP